MQHADMDTDITFYYSIGSRYSYLASTQIDALAKRHQCNVHWKPVEGFELRSLTSSDPFRAQVLSGQYKSPFRENDIAAWADLYQIPYREPPSINGELWWKEYDFRPLARFAATGYLLDQTERVSVALFSQLFATDIWPLDELSCLNCVEAAGVDRDLYTQTLTTEDVDGVLTRLANEAADKGVFGVPSFLVDGKLFFGNDRLVLLDRYLSKRAK